MEVKDNFYPYVLKWKIKSDGYVSKYIYSLSSLLWTPKYIIKNTTYSVPFTYNLSIPFCYKFPK